MAVITLPNRDVETYQWDNAVAWHTVTSAMFSNIPQGSYELLVTLGWGISEVHNAATITYPGGSFKLGYGGAEAGGYKTFTLFLTLDSIGDIDLLAGAQASNADSILRPSATLRRIYR